MIPPDLNALHDDRSDPDVRAVLEDWTLSQGARVTRLGCALSYIHADDAADDDADANADPGADGGVAIQRARKRRECLIGDLHLENGLKVIQIPGYYSGYAATFVCWLRRIAGDEWEMAPGYRAIYRTGERRGLSWLAANGPGKDYQLKEPSAVAESVHRLLIRRCPNADERAWAKECPRPKDWTSK